LTVDGNDLRFFSAGPVNGVALAGDVDDWINTRNDRICLKLHVALADGTPSLVIVTTAALAKVFPTSAVAHLLGKQPAAQSGTAVRAFRRTRPA